MVSSVRRSAVPLLVLGVIITVIALCCLCATPTHGAHAFDAYRLVQYDRGTRALGSRRTAINLQATVQSLADDQATASDDEWIADGALNADDDISEQSTPQSAAADLYRKVVVVPIASLTPAKLRNLLRVRLASGLLIVLPADLSSVDNASLARFRLLEKFLAQRSWDVAIYFAFDDEYLQSMITNLRATVDGTPTTPDRYHLQVTTADATALTGATVNNLHGWQHAAASSTGDSDTLPTIAIVSSYDSLGGAAGLARGADSASGALALLELSRVFARLYADFRTQGSYNLLFILTAMDRFNYITTKNWLRNIDSRVLESLEFALCLDRLATAPVAAVAGGNATSPLYLHVSKLAKTPELQALYGNFASTADEMDMTFQLVHRKINISSPHVFWQHEQFSRKRIVAATLSTQKEPPASLWDSGSIFDDIRHVDVEILSRNIKFIVESLAKQIYGFGKISAAAVGAKAEVTSAPLEVLDAAQGLSSPQSLRAYLGLLVAQSRFTALAEPTPASSTKTATTAAATSSTVSSSSIVGLLESHFAKFTSDHKKQTFHVDQILGASASGAGVGGAWKFYKDKEGGVDASRPRLGVVEMQAFQVKPLMFDVYFSLSIAAYLLVVYILCKQPSNVADVVAILIGK